MSNVKYDERLIDIHPQMAASAAESDGDVIGHYLRCDHGERLGLRRIDLARHDRRARFIRQNNEFRETGARTARHQPDVIGDLVKGNCEGPPLNPTFDTTAPRFRFLRENWRASLKFVGLSYV
jgi:hypothetical protein